MVYNIFFEDKLAKVSTHGWFTIWSLANDPRAGSQQAARCVEMIGAGRATEIGLHYIIEGDCLLEDLDERNLDPTRERLAAFWHTLTSEQHKERAKEHAKERVSASNVITAEETESARVTVLGCFTVTVRNSYGRNCLVEVFKNEKLADAFACLRVAEAAENADYIPEDKKAEIIRLTNEGRFYDAYDAYRQYEDGDGERQYVIDLVCSPVREAVTFDDPVFVEI